MAQPPDLTRRLFTALAGAAIFLLALFAHPGSLAGAFGLIALLSLWELGRLTRESYRRPVYFPVLPAFLLGFGYPLTWIFPALEGLRWSLLLVPLVMLAGLLVRDAGNRKAALVALAGTFWIALPMAAMADLGAGQGRFEPLPLMGLLFLIWSNDVGAYFAGSRFGRTKLAPAISPNKSWEGVLGGMGLGLLMALVLHRFIPEPGLGAWLGLALVCTLTGTLGDLAESRLKRAFHTKDSGGLLPGHGGFLDRFDSLFTTAPVAWALFRWVF
jgi:phosphatidate cytidylyltransferase